MAAPQFKKLEPKLKTEKEIADKKKEKDRAKTGKSEKSDFAPIEEFYRDYYIPRLTDSSADAINEARKEILDDIAAVESNKDIQAQYNEKLIRQLRVLAGKDREGKTFSPTTRIVAATILGRLNLLVPKGGSNPPTPDPAVLAALGPMLDTKELDGLASSAMSTLARHLSRGGVNENYRKAFLPKLQAYLELPIAPNRNEEARDYLVGQAFECVALIAKMEPDKDVSKQAVAMLLPILISTIESDKSEWLIESALLCFGNLPQTTIAPEDIAKLEKGMAKFIKRSLKDWRGRIDNSASSVATSGYPGGGGPGGPGGARPGAGSGGGAGSGSGSDEGAPAGPGGGGYPGAPSGSTRPTNPFADQPKEVKNARRIAHQRFERIHYALNGAYRKTPVADANAAPKGLLAYAATDEKKTAINLLIEKVEKLQTDLNDDKVKDLPTLLVAVGKSTKELRAAYQPLMGDEKAKSDTADEKDSDTEPFGN